jgi:hypothetical protein
MHNRFTNTSSPNPGFVTLCLKQRSTADWEAVEITADVSSMRNQLIRAADPWTILS